MSPELETQTLDNIKNAHQLKGETVTTYKVGFSNFAEWLEGLIKKFGPNPCLRYYSPDLTTTESYTYQELNKKINRVINFLCMKLGVRRGDAVATMLGNHPDTIATYLATIKFGAVLVPLSPDMDDKNLSYTLQNANAKVVISYDKYIDRLLALKSSLPALRHLIQVGEMKNEESISFSESISISSPIFSPKEITTIDDPALILYAAGASGLPRGIVLTQYNLLVNAANIVKALGYSPASRVLTALPLHNVNEIVTSILAPMTGGGTLILTEFNPTHCAKIIGQEKINSVNTTPTQLRQCQENIAFFKGVDLSAFKYFVCGRGLLDPKLVKEINGALNVKVIQGYGLSESAGYATLVPPDLNPAEYKQWLETAPLSVGVPVGNVEIAVIDEEGRELPPGKEGEVVMRGHSIMKGYYKTPDETNEAFKYGWFHTGDVGFYKAGPRNQLYLFLTGRLKEIINRAGTKIAPTEVESTLYETAGVKWGLIVGFANKWTGEEVGAYVIPDKDAKITEKDILEYCRTKLGVVKCPKAVVFGKEIPSEPSRRVLRQQLRANFSAWAETKFE